MDLGVTADPPVECFFTDQKNFQGSDVMLAALFLFPTPTLTCVGVNETFPLLSSADHSCSGRTVGRPVRAPQNGNDKCVSIKVPFQHEQYQ